MSFSIVQYSMRPGRIIRLRRNNSPFDLTGATSVTFVFKTRTGSGARRTGPCTVLDAAQGKVRYDWVEGDTDVAGDYACSFVVDFDGVEESIPNAGYADFKIIPRL